MNQIVKYNKPRAGSGAVSASGAAVALQSLAGLLTEAQLSVILEGYLLKETFDDLFVKEPDGKGGYRIQAKYALYTNSWMSCLGANPDAGTVALGATTLGGLNNVVAAADEATAAAKVLVREAGASSWSLKNLSDIVGLDTAALNTYLVNNHYATQQWVQLQGYLTQHQSLAGYAKEAWVQAQGYLTGITKAQVEAVLTGNITSHTHSQYLTSALASQTYQPVGDYATNTALNSAVTALNTAISAKLDTATFDDLFAKESDGKGGYRIKAKYALYSSQYISCLGNNHDAGTTTPSTPGVDLDAVADYLQQQGYATQAWVQAQGYVTSLANYYTKAEVDAKNFIKDAGDGRNLQFNYSADALGYDSFTWVAVWNGNTLQCCHKNLFAMASSLANYVTLDTAQTITGVKTLGIRIGSPAFGANIDRLIITPYGHTAGPWKLNSLDDPSEAWLRFMYGPTETIAFNNNGVFYANSIRKRGGTSSQFLKADGSVDGNTYLTAHQSLDYINVLDTRNAETTTSMAQRLTAHFKGNDKIGLADGGLYTGLLHLQPWTDASGGSAHDIAFTVNGNMWLRTGAIGSAWGAWRKVLDTNNYTSVLDSRYVHGNYIGCGYGAPTLEWSWGSNLTHVVGFEGANNGAMRVYNGAAIRAFANAVNKAGDTMTGVLSIANVADNYLLKAQYNTAGAYSNVLWANRSEARVIFGSPNWATVELETAGAAVWRRTAGTTYKIWDSGNDGSGSGLDADLLDGLHSWDFNRCASPSWTNGETVQAWAKRLGWANPTLYNETSWGWAYSKLLTVGGYSIDSMRYSALDIRRGNLNEAWKQKAIMFLPTYGDVEMIYIAQMSVSGTGGEVTLNAVRRYATYDTILASNVASATRLQSTYSIWGQSFYGNNVSGNMTGVGTINTAAAPINTIYASDWYRSVGATGWYNETYAGGWHMDNATWIKAWQKPVFIAHTALEGANSFGVGLRCYHANHTSVEVQGGAYTMGLGCHSNGSWHWWRGTSAGKSYVMIYNGTEWSFNGVIKSSTGMYSDGYMSCLGQNTGSDLRLKHIMGDATLTLDVIADAPAKVFRWLYGPFAGRVAVGTIAQYWQQWLAPVVSKRPTDDYLQMDYGVTATVGLINLARIVRDGLTDHERRILALERENQGLKSKNQELESKINDLERRLAA